MSEEQQRREGAARGGSEPDETSQFEPFAEQAPSNDDPRPGESWVFDRTEPMPRTSPDRTEPMPPVGRDGVDPAAAGGSVWAARAEVRPPRPSDDFTPEDWAAPAPGEPRGRWWMPIVAGIVVLILLALLGWGIWLIVQAVNSNSERAPAPAVTTSAATTEPTPTATTTEPTTTPTTTEPTGPQEVTIPALKGLSSVEARQALDRRGLAYRLRFVTSDAAADTVIDCDPAEGQQVPSDTTVTLIIAAQPSSSPSPSTTPPTTTGDQPGQD
jgi:PASTA domain